MFNEFLTVKSFATINELLTVVSKSIVKAVFETSTSNKLVFDAFVIEKSFLNVAELFTVISKSSANVVFATSIANTFVDDEFEMLNVLSPSNVTSFPIFNVLLMIVAPATSHCTV